MYLAIKNIRKNKFLSLVMFASFFISFVSISISAIINESKADFIKMNEIGFKGKNKIVSVNVKDNNEFEKVIDEIQSAFTQSDVYIRNIKIKTDSGSVQGIAVNLKDDYYWKPYINKGRYFTKKDQTAIVIGNSTPMDRIQDFKGYSDIGTVSRENTDIGISTIYVPLQNLPQNIKEAIVSNGLVELTVINPTKNMDNEIDIFRKNINVSLAKDVQVENEAAAPKLLNGSDKTTLYYYKFLIISIVSGVSVVLFWIYKKQEEISLKKALGASSFIIYLEFSFQLLIIAFAALIISFGTIFMLSNSIHKYFYTYLLKPLTLNVVISDLCFLLALIIVITLVPIKHIVKIYPGKVLKS